MHSTRLNTILAAELAQCALAGVVTQFPHKLDHMINSAADHLLPRQYHPAFYGCYDWHSAVHMHWSLARLLRLFPQLTDADQITALFDAHLTAENIAQERTYLDAPNRASFERPYGWVWLLKLQAELVLLAKDLPHAARWRDALAPLAQIFRDRLIAFLQKSDYPVHAGTHTNSAFALLLALDYATAHQDPALRQAIEAKAQAWFGKDAHYPAHYEPNGTDFLSAGLCEAALMTRVYLRFTDSCSLADWWQQFRPSDTALATWLTPARVADRIDPQIVHLDGLNLSRAWCWKLIRNETDLPREVLERAIDAHLDATLPHVTQGDFAATHWLVSFALLALTESESAI
jgi:Protein of unknown function (DUF2891)